MFKYPSSLCIHFESCECLTDLNVVSLVKIQLTSNTSDTKFCICARTLYLSLAEIKYT